MLPVFESVTAHFVCWRVFFGIESISIECSCSVLFWRAKVWRLHNSTFSQLRKMNKLSPWLQNYPKLSWVYVNKSQSCKKAFQTNKQASKTIDLYWCKHSYKFNFHSRKYSILAMKYCISIHFTSKIKEIFFSFWRCRLVLAFSTDLNVSFLIHI